MDNRVSLVVAERVDKTGQIANILANEIPALVAELETQVILPRLRIDKRNRAPLRDGFTRVGCCNKPGSSNDDVHKCPLKYAYAPLRAAIICSLSSARAMVAAPDA